MRPRLVVVAGMSGAGKSTLDAALAQRLGARFIEGDDLHPAANRAAMAAGQPLDDAMRAGWLDSVGAALAASHAAGQGAVAACSALTRAYRDRLRDAAGAPVAFLCLIAPAGALQDRLRRRSGHFMPLSLLPSQLATWQSPDPDEPDTHVLNALLDPPALLDAALAALG
ncbi:MAG: gluconokinase [Defluviimonas sp.]|nr:gluconokinase [Defluviimonas sp.]